MNIVVGVNDWHRLLVSLLVASSILMITACASADKGLTLSDLKSRFWKGTYYLSVKESPTSIKCVVDESYTSPSSVPVTYQGMDANKLFRLEEDQAKIKQLQKQCFSGPKY